MRRYLLALCLLLGSNRAFGQSVAVFVSEHINVGDDDVLAFGTVCTDRFSQVSHQSAIPFDRADEALKASTRGVEGAAAAVGSADYLDIQLVRLGEGSSQKILLLATRVSPSAQIRREARIDMASLADAPAACDRIAKSTLTDTPVQDVADRTNITQAEAQETGSPARLGFEKAPYVMVAVGSPLQSGYEPLGNFRLGLGLERDRYRIDLGAGFYFPAAGGDAASYGGLVTELGVDYFLSESVNTFYVGAGVEPRLNFGGSILELAPYAEIGGMLFRDSSARLFAELRIAQNLFPVVSSTSTAASGALPTEANLFIGVAF